MGIKQMVMIVAAILVVLTGYFTYSSIVARRNLEASLQTMIDQEYDESRAHKIDTSVF